MASTLIRKEQLVNLAIVNSDVAEGAAIASSKLADGANWIKKDGSVAFTADQSMGNHKLTNLAAPVSANDAARLVDVQNAAAGISAKEPVRAATTENVTLSGTQTVDGVALAAGDRVLVKAQSTGSENGIYVVASGAWARAADANTSAQMKSGTYCFVTEGTLNCDSGWILSTDGDISLGSTSLLFVQFSGAGTITAGDGLQRSGSTLSAKSANSSRISISSSGIDLATVVTAGTVGNSGANVANITFDKYGRITAAANRALTCADLGAQPADAVLTSLSAASVGVIVQTSDGVIAARTIAQGTGITVTNGNGVSGNPTIALASNVCTAGTYSSVTVDVYGRVTAGTNPAVLSPASVVTREEPTGLVNGSNATFTLSNTPVNGTEQVYLNGILLDSGAGNDYTIVGETITMLVIPQSNDKLRVSYLK